MQLFPSTVVIRHCKENLKKCSLRGLESRSDFRFFTYPTFPTPLPDLSGYILLTLDAPPLTPADHACGILVLDATWRYAEKMQRYILQQNIPLIHRSLPSHYRTAYPRVQTACSDPERGLASIEAIYLCYKILGRKTDGLLDTYHWKETFLELNQAVGSSQ